MSDVPAEPLGSRRGWPPWLRGLRAAFAFLSRVPVGGFPYGADDWRWAPAYFPVVGVVVGGASAAVLLVSWPLGAGVAAVLALLTSVWLTGGFHEDGLADSADALGGGHGGKAALEIMRDSRIGTYGALALTLVLALRATLLAELGPEGCLALPLAHCWARIGPVWLIATQPLASAAGGKGSLVSRAGVAQASVATAIGLFVGALLVFCPRIEVIALLPAAAALALLTLWSARFSKRAVGGVTGDLLGASEQLGEALVLLSVLGSLRWLC